MDPKATQDQSSPTASTAHDQRCQIQRLEFVAKTRILAEMKIAYEN